MLNKFVESIKDVNFSEMKIPIAVIYNSPKDFPGRYLCRIWEGCQPTNIIMKKMTLEEIREDIKVAGFSIMFPRAEGEDPVIQETWMR